MIKDMLAPVTAALLEKAQEQADVEVISAREQAAGAVAQAQAEADRLVAVALEQATADAEAVSRVERRRGQREARSIVLAAQQNAYASLRSACFAAASRLQADPRYPKWRDGMARYAAGVLGADAVTNDIPEGGISAVAGNRRLDLSLAAFAERSLAAGSGLPPGDLP